MNTKFVLILLLLSCSLEGFCQVIQPPPGKFYRHDSLYAYPLWLPTGSKVKLPATTKELLVIALLSPECPLCIGYSGKLETMRQKYSASASFAGIIPGSFEVKDITAFQKKYLPGWKIFWDKSLRLTKYLGGLVTPEVIVINNRNGELVYKGAIDDWVVALGKTKNHVSSYYLDTALNNFLHHQTYITFIKPVGCLINDF